MARYYFNIYEHDHLIRDLEGTELPTVKAAREEAEASAREFLADALRQHSEVNGKRIEIADANGSVVETIRVRDVLRCQKRS
jgi:hypothetical protein